MRIALCFLLSIMSWCSIFCQSIISHANVSASHHHQNELGSLVGSVGEVAIQRYASKETVIFEGFLFPFERLIVSNDEFQKLDLRSYPNPFSAGFKIDYQGTRLVEMEICDFLGKEILHIQIPPFTKKEISTSHWPIGMYQLRVLDAKLNYTSVLIKSH